MKLKIYAAKLGQTKFDCFSAGIAYGRLFEAVDRAEAAAIRGHGGDLSRFTEEAQRHMTTLRLSLPALGQRYFGEVSQELERASTPRAPFKASAKHLGKARFILIEHGSRHIQDTLCRERQS